MPQPQVPGERDHLVADALHQAAVADQRVGVVVDDVVAELGVEHRLGHRHADGVGDPLAERAGGDLDAVAGSYSGWPGVCEPSSPEGADLLDRERLVAGEVQQRVDQRRAVAVGLDEAVAVRPARDRRVELQVAVEQRRADVGGPQRRPGVAVAGARDGVHGEEADGVGHLLRSDGHGGVSFGAWHVRWASGVGRGLGRCLLPPAGRSPWCGGDRRHAGAAGSGGRFRRNRGRRFAASQGSSGVAGGVVRRAGAPGATKQCMRKRIHNRIRKKRQGVCRASPAKLILRKGSGTGLRRTVAGGAPPRSRPGSGTPRRGDRRTRAWLDAPARRGARFLDRRQRRSGGVCARLLVPCPRTCPPSTSSPKRRTARRGTRRSACCTCARCCA